MNKSRVSMALAPLALMFGVLGSSNASADYFLNEVVNCDQGENVQQVLDNNVLSFSVEIRLIGTCSGFEIKQDDVLVRPNDEQCPGATVEGGIVASGGSRIELRCLVVTGADIGVEVSGGDVYLQEMDIYGNAETGVFAFNGTVGTGAGSIHNNHEGIALENGAYADIVGTEIYGNAGNGYSASGNSVAYYGESSIHDNGDNGLFITSNSTLYLEAATIMNNGDAGVALMNHSLLETEESAQIVGNGDAGLRLATDSGAILAPDTNIPASMPMGFAIVCEDKESSVKYDADAMQAGLIGLVHCPGGGF
jgi:hypothetical protein